MYKLQHLDPPCCQYWLATIKPRSCMLSGPRIISYTHRFLFWQNGLNSGALVCVPSYSILPDISYKCEKCNVLVGVTLRLFHVTECCSLYTTKSICRPCAPSYSICMEDISYRCAQCKIVVGTTLRLFHMPEYRSSYMMQSICKSCWQPCKVCRMRMVPVPLLLPEPFIYNLNSHVLARYTSQRIMNGSHGSTPTEYITQE